MSLLIEKIVVEEKVMKYREDSTYYCDICREGRVITLEVEGSNDRGKYRINICKKCLDLAARKFPHKIEYVNK